MEKSDFLYPSHLQGESERSTTDLWKIIEKDMGVLWLKYLYMTQNYIMFLVYCEQIRLFENPIFKIWAIEHYYPRNLPLRGCVLK